MGNARHSAPRCPFLGFARSLRPHGDPRPFPGRFAGPNPPRGFTIIELVIVIAVTGVLLALLLPAIQASRESARKQNCSSNLKQLGIATQAYASSHGVLPNYGPGWSALVNMLAELDQPAMAADFSANYHKATVRHQPARLPVFLCPSETYSGAGSGIVNYGMNWGRFAGEEPIGGFYALRSLGFSDVPDGASNTAWIAEFRVGHTGNPEAFIITITPHQLSEDDFASLCEHSTVIGNGTGRGTPWPEGWDTSYDHLLPPNRHNCINGDYPSRTYNAGSHHTGGANILLLDGSVRFISDHVDRGAWRSLGTRNGDEPVSF